MKRSINFRDSMKSFITLEVNIDKKVRNSKTIDLEDITEYKVLSISGDIKELTNGRGRPRWSSGGQIENNIITTNGNVLRLIEIWNRWHLNNMQSGTRKQNECLENWKNRPEGWSYDEDCKYLKKHHFYTDRKYKYGHAWLVELLPENIISEVESLCNVIDN